MALPLLHTLLGVANDGLTEAASPKGNVDDELKTGTGAPKIGMDADDGTMCPVCYNPLRSARVPPCGHALCAACVKGLAAATTRVASVPDNWRSPPSSETLTPQCPVCKAAVHESQYTRCYALDKAVEIMHPPTGEEKQAAADAAASEPTPLEDWRVEDLHRWQAAEEERLIQTAMRVVIQGIQECESSSDGLLLDETSPPGVSSMDMNLCRVRGGSAPRRSGGNGHDMSVMSLTVQHPSVVVDHPLKDLQKAWNIFWRASEKIAARLQARGLTIDRFKFNGVRYALVKWGG